MIMLHSPEERTCHGKNLKEALALNRVQLMAAELGIGPVLV
jgi:hypothetical protein